jgi:hypothetical protein
MHEPTVDGLAAAVADPIAPEPTRLLAAAGGVG